MDDPPVDAPSFQERFEVLKTIFATRLSNVVRSLKDSVGSVPQDEPARALGDHPDSSVFIGARIEEIVQTALHSEREAFIVKLGEALATREAELRSLSRISGKAQHAWHQRLQQLQDANAALQAQLTDVTSRAHDDGLTMQVLLVYLSTIVSFLLSCVTSYCSVCHNAAYISGTCRCE